MLGLKKLLIKILECLKIDYIVEEGTSDFGTYRKGNSGIAECGGMKPATSYAMTSTSGNGYYVTSSMSLPTNLFLTVNNVNCTRGNGDNGLVSISTYSITTTTITYFIFDTASATKTCGVYGYVTGTWK